MIWLRAVPANSSEDDFPAQVAWSREIEQTLRANRGEILATVGLSVAAAFDAQDARAAIAATHALLGRSMQSEPDVPAMAGGAALGEIRRSKSPPHFRGLTIDRAQRLAHQAKPGRLSALDDVQRIMNVSPETEPTLPPVQAEERDTGAMLQVMMAAIAARDFGALHRLLDRAATEGRDPVAIDRLRALAHLGHGDAENAMRALGNDPSSQERTRDRLMKTLILLMGNQAGQAVREGLATLAEVRSKKDARGERAAMHALAMCYHALERENEAEAIQRASLSS